MLLRELADRAGVTPRTVRYYLERRLLPQPEPRGTATRYGRLHLLRLYAIQRLQQSERLGLDAIRRRIEGLSISDLEQYAPRPPSVETPPSPSSGLAPPAAPTFSAETWQKIALIPGLELHMRADASPLVRKLAQDIHAHCASASDCENEILNPRV